MLITDELRRKLEPLRRELWAERNSVLPVVGSGLSRGLASWTELLRELINELPEGERQDAEDALNKDKYVEVASWIEQVIGGQRIATRIRELYQRPATPRPPVYDALVALPVQHFVTTNYDPWLKDALASHIRAAPRVYGPTDGDAFTHFRGASEPLVLMVHGDADRAGGCVLGTEGYRKIAYGNPVWVQGLRTLLGSRCLLFLGYSRSELHGLLDEWQVGAPSDGPTRHFLLGAGIRPMWAHVLRNLRIEPVDYDDHALLPDILRYLAIPRLIEGMNTAVREFVEPDAREQQYVPRNSPLATLAARLLSSPDPRDQVGLTLLPVLQKESRLTLADALAVARDRGLSEADALAGLERLARPDTAGLRRFYVDRSGTTPHLLEPEEVRMNLVALHGDKKERVRWASSIEVAWAASRSAALGWGDRE
jgi:hypothetical protein